MLIVFPTRVAPDIDCLVAQTIAGLVYNTDLFTNATVVRVIGCHGLFTGYSWRKGE